jgi:hypothetical protein
MDRSLYSLESRFLFLESALKRDYEKETMTALYAMIAGAEDRDEMCRRLADLMQENRSDEALLSRAQSLCESKKEGL